MGGLHGSALHPKPRQCWPQVRSCRGEVGQCAPAQLRAASVKRWARSRPAAPPLAGQAHGKSHTPLLLYKGGLEARAAEPAAFPVGEAGVEEWGTQRALVPVAALPPPTPAALAAAFPALRAAVISIMSRR